MNWVLEGLLGRWYPWSPVIGYEESVASSIASLDREIVVATASCPEFLAIGRWVCNVLVCDAECSTGHGSVHVPFAASRRVAIGREFEGSALLNEETNGV